MNDTQTYIVASLAILVVILIAYNYGLSSSQPIATPSNTPTTIIVEPEPWIWWNPTTWYPWWWYGSSSSGSYYRPYYPRHRPDYHHDRPDHHKPRPPTLPRPPSQQPHLPQIPNMGPSLKPISVPSIHSNPSTPSNITASHTSTPSVPSGSSMTMGSQTSGKENFANYNYPINNIEGFSSGCNSRPQNPFLFESIAMEHALPTSQSITPSAHALKISQPNLPNAYISNSNYHLL